MAYLTFTNSNENSSCFKFIGAETKDSHVNLITADTSLISNNTSLIFNSNDSGLDDCSFYSGPSDSTILAFGENLESTGALAYSSESCGSIAYSDGGESCGSIASSTSSSFSGGCSFTC